MRAGRRAFEVWEVPSPATLWDSEDARTELLQRAKLRELAVVRAPELDGCLAHGGGGRAFLGVECLQVTGSYHVRGALLAVASSVDGAVVAPGAGRHGIAVAYAAAALGRRCTLVVPADAPPALRERALAYGAHLESVHGGVAGPRALRADDRALLLGQIALATAQSRGGRLLSPTEPALHAGNGITLLDEMVRAMGALPGCIVVPSGSGALPDALAASLAARDGSVRPRVLAVRGAEPHLAEARGTQPDGTQPHLAEPPSAVRGEDDGGHVAAAGAVLWSSVAEEHAVQESAALAATLGVAVEPWAAAGIAWARRGLAALPSAPEGDVLFLVPARRLGAAQPTRASWPPPLTGPP
mgnify:CR=1 FL=1